MSEEESRWADRFCTMVTTRRLTLEDIREMCAWCMENQIRVRHPTHTSKRRWICLVDFSENSILYASGVAITETYRFGHTEWCWNFLIEDVGGKAALFKLMWG